MTNADYCTYFDSLPVTPISDQGAVVALEDPGTIKIVHGYARAKLNTGKFIKVEQSMELPRYATEVTVFLNGWRLMYAGGDNHVQGLGTFIARIRPGVGNVTWNAFGVLADEDHDNAYEWTYHYTLVAWNEYKLQARVRPIFPGWARGDSDMDGFCSTNQPDISDNLFWSNNADTTTALSAFPSCVRKMNLSLGRAALLPRGFGFRWGSDHHLLQLAYNLDFSEEIVQNHFYRKDFGNIKPLPHPNGRVGNQYVTWNTYAILKDDDDRRDYSFGEIISVVGGQDVNPIQVPFYILPFTPAQGGFSGSGVKTQDVAIDSIHFDYAIPMLTGWEIGYTTSDQHVKEIGIWIDKFDYNKPVNYPNGTLNYRVSSVLRDDDSDPDNYFRHKITILALRPAGPGTGPEP